MTITRHRLPSSRSIVSTGGASNPGISGRSNAEDSRAVRRPSAGRAEPDWQELTVFGARRPDGRTRPSAGEALALGREPVEQRRGRPELVGALLLELQHPVTHGSQADR